MSKFVKVAQFGQSVREVLLEEGATVQDVLYSTGTILLPGYGVRVNGVDLPLDTIAPHNAVVTLVAQIKGGAEDPPGGVGLIRKEVCASGLSTL